MITIPPFVFNKNRNENTYLVGSGLSKAQKNKITKIIKPISREDAIKSYEKLEEIDCNNIKDSISSRKGNDFIDFFTFGNRLDTIGNKGMSFWEFLNKKNEYSKKQYIKNVIEYYKKKKNNRDSASVWYQIFNLYFGSISIFKPVIAMDIYCKYKPKSVLDMTMGWGGRLVGACALDIPKYTGIDLNTSLKKSYEDMVKVLKQYSKTDITLYFKSALDIDYSKINYDMVLTSPPYYNIETYKGQTKITKDEWDNEFYAPLFEKTFKYLQKGGHYCLNIPSEVYERIATKILGKADEFIPLYKSKRTANEKYKEYIYVWKK